jgi:hypothetical protein
MIPEPKEGLIMAVVLKKKIQVEEEPELSDLAALIDELGELQPKFERRKRRLKLLEVAQETYKAKFKRLQELIAEDDDDHHDDDSFVELGTTFRAEFGKKGCSRRIADIQKVRELMGDETFFKVCSVALKDIDDYLNPEERAQVLETERGLRGVKITKRA